MFYVFYIARLLQLINLIFWSLLYNVTQVDQLRT